MKAYHITEKNKGEIIRKRGFNKNQGLFGLAVYLYDSAEKAIKRGKEVNNQFSKNDLDIIEVDLLLNGYIFLNTHKEYEKFCEENDCSPGNRVSWKTDDLVNKGIKGIIFNTEYINEIVVYDLNTIKIL